MQRAGNANTSSWNTRKTKWHDCRAITIEMSLCVRVIIVTSRTLVQLPSLLALDAPNMTRVIQMGPVGMGTALAHRGAVRIAIEGFARPLHMALRIENEEETTSATGWRLRCLRSSLYVRNGMSGIAQNFERWLHTSSKSNASTSTRATRPTRT